MRKRRPKGYGLSIIGLMVLSILLPGCPPPQDSGLEELARRPGNMGFRNMLLGNERLVSLEEGNLSDGTASSGQERIDRLATFVQTYADSFGVSSEEAAQVAFLAAAPEQQSVINDDELHQTVFLNQEHEGAIVLDALLLGEYVGLAETGAQLRRVQGRLFDPASLPVPIPSNSDTLGMANGIFREFLEENGLSLDNMSVLPTPVILGEKNITGFLGHYAFGYEDGSMDRLSAVINPLTDEIHIVYSMPACRAHNTLGDAS